MEEIIFISTKKKELINLFINALESYESTKKNTNKNSKNYLTRDEVAEICGIKSLSTLWHWKEKGLLVPKLRAGRKPLYKLKDVINFLEGRKEDWNE